MLYSLSPYETYRDVYLWVLGLLGSIFWRGDGTLISLFPLHGSHRAKTSASTFSACHRRTMQTLLFPCPHLFWLLFSEFLNVSKLNWNRLGGCVIGVGGGKESDGVWCGHRRVTIVRKRIGSPTQLRRYFYLCVSAAGGDFYCPFCLRYIPRWPFSRFFPDTGRRGSYQTWSIWGKQKTGKLEAHEHNGQLVCPSVKYTLLLFLILIWLVAVVVVATGHRQGDVV